MKKQYIFAGDEAYVTPRFDVVEVISERGFANSDTSDDNPWSDTYPEEQI